MPRGKKKSTRKNVTTACLECKKSKTKCTGNTPCGNCTKRVMNRCKACKNNIKDIDISKLEACGKCQTQASKSCEFPQEKPRRGPPPRKTNQKAINCITINRIDNSDNNNNNNNNIISNNDNNVLVSPYESSSATFSPNSNFSPFLPPLSLSFPFPSPPPDTPFDIKDKNIFGEGVLFDYTKETMNIDSVNDDSLFSEFIIFEESISDDNNNDDIDNNNNGDDNNNGGNNNKEEDDKLSSTTTISTSTIPTATMQIPTETAIIPGVATEDYNNNNNYYYCDQQLPHDPDYIYIFQPHNYTLYGHLPRTEMDLLLGLSQAPPSIIAPLEGQYTAGTQ